MNLRDKLNAISAKPKQAPRVQQPASQDCRIREELRPLSGFPGAFSLNAAALPLMQEEPLPDPLDPGGIVYLDTETTGLMGGAGTIVFEAGVGRLTPDGFRIRQFVIRDYHEERYLLAHLREEVEQGSLLCTFNGKTFDVPLLRDRLLMNRMDAAFLDLPHIDLLQIARRVWKLRLKRCNLSRLEEEILGTPRTDDLPGSEVPARFFSFIKTGRPELLEDVLTHNAQDIASLCVLLQRMTEIYAHPELQVHQEDLFSMGHSLERHGHHAEARKCWYLCSKGAIGEAGSLRLAANWRRNGNRSESVRIWERMIASHQGGVVPYVELAKHYEHVQHQPEAALELTEKALLLLAEPGFLPEKAVQEARIAVQYRYARLKKKCGR